ncbi:hypothetical protein OUZ56_003246 [Daphnia magna]|uniref:Uncharacterized protein n=1 Tax=Daphnia magna TaxID=35525 RepID=A0ABR0A8F3_9CRUS|nr:hypothetical protein OUZ56_003246 [Daphnia magna]
MAQTVPHPAQTQTDTRTQGRQEEIMDHTISILHQRKQPTHPSTHSGRRSAGHQMGGRQFNTVGKQDGKIVGRAQPVGGSLFAKVQAKDKIKTGKGRGIASGNNLQ